FYDGLLWVMSSARFHAGIIKLVDQGTGGFQLIIMEDGVEGYEYPGPILVSEFHQFGDLRHAVFGIVPGAETRPANVHGIGSVQDRFPGDGCVETAKG